MAWKDKAEYRAKLQDPRWQKRRLEILERDKWTCQCCRAGLTSKKQLHVHHRVYKPGDPWDAPDFALVTLCSDCHEYETKESRAMEDSMIRGMLMAGFFTEDFRTVRDALLEFVAKHESISMLPEAIAFVILDKTIRDEVMQRLMGGTDAQAS